MKLSILDQSPVSTGMTPGEALANTIALARLADRLGFHRYWIAEHHAMTMLASPAPEILIARIGAETERLRIGSGGVLLPHYAPLKVVEQFRMLHALYPDRTDLGLGRAPGGTPLEAAALRRNRDAPQLDDFGQQLVELLAFLRGEFPRSHPFSRIHVAPAMPGGPEVWLLGSSLWSASAAAQLSLPYAFAHFIAPGETRQALDRYRETYVASADAPHPRTILALGAIAAETTAEAERLSLSVRLIHRWIRSGIVRPVPSPEEAAAELGIAAHEPHPRESEWPRYVAGDPASIAGQLTDISRLLGVDEIMIVTIMHDHAQRLRSHELIAQALKLG